MRRTLLPIIVSILTIYSFAQETIDVSVQGISDGYKNSKQQDRDEAIMDAKLKAIERAGISIEAVTTMEDFKLKNDWVESKASAVIMPGFQIIDIGYGADGLYHVVLTGRVSCTAREISGTSEGEKKFRMAKLYLEDDKQKALGMLKEVVDDYGDCSAADDALYYLIVESAYNSGSAKDMLIKLKAYYPDSPYISSVESFIQRKEEENRRLADEELQEKLRIAEEKRQDSLRTVEGKLRKQAEAEKLHFVPIPEGTFMMGTTWGNSDMKPLHSVYVESFKMQTTEVTQEQWKAVMRTDPPIRLFKGDNLPVRCVSWNNVQNFINKLNRMDPGKNYRLPSEAEWEYACRAGTASEYYTGDDESDLSRAGWYRGNSGGEAHPVAQKEPNAWGLYDMHGNVCEWCEDWDHDTYDGAPADGSAWLYPPGSKRVSRGGSFIGFPGHCRSAFRHRDSPDRPRGTFGFRLVCNP